jgi:hypothetical protein
MSIEALMLTLPFAIYAKVLAVFLGQTESLEAIYLSPSVTSGYEDGEYAALLSSYYKSLREVWFSYGKWSAKLVHLKKVARNYFVGTDRAGNSGDVIGFQVVRKPYRWEY